MRKPTDMSRCLAALAQDSTLVAVIELGQQGWLVAGIVPGIERHPLKKLEVDEAALLNSCSAGARRRERQAIPSSAFA